MNAHLFYLCKRVKTGKTYKSGIIFSCAIKRLLQANVPSRLNDLKAYQYTRYELEQGYSKNTVVFLK